MTVDETGVDETGVDETIVGTQESICKRMWSD